MKKVLCLILILFLLTGCEGIKKIKSDKNFNNYSLKSTSDRLVFRNENKYEIVYFENEKIIKVESAIKFNSENEAKEYYLKESYGNNNTIKYVYNIFIIEQLDDYFEDYKDLSKEQLIDYMQNANYVKV